MGFHYILNPPRISFFVTLISMLQSNYVTVLKHTPGPEVIKKYLLNSAEHGSYPAHKC